MAARPYRHLRIDVLERLFDKSRANKSCLRAILGELHNRSTARAVDMKRRLEKHLKTVFAASSNEPASVRPQPSPTTRPVQKDFGRSEAAPAAPTLREPKVLPIQAPAPPLHQQRVDPETRITPPDEASPRTAPPEADKPELSTSQRGVTQLIDYVRVLIELSDKAAWSLGNYGNVVLHEDQLRNRVGIRHDLPDVDGPVFLKIDRLRRIEPPDPPAVARDWLTVNRDPFKEPVIQSIRTAVLSGAEAAKLIQDGAIAAADVTLTLKPKPGKISETWFCGWRNFRRAGLRFRNMSRRHGQNGRRPNARGGRRLTSMTGSSAFSRL